MNHLRLSLFNLLLLFTIACLAVSQLTPLFVPRLFDGNRVEPKSIHIRTFYEPYAWDVDDELIAATPNWDPANANPPLSNRDALKIAAKLMQDLEESSDKFCNWQLASIGLVPLRWKNGDGEKWCYLLNYWGYNAPLHSGEPIGFAAVLLMDESVLVPDGYNEYGIVKNLRAKYPR